MIWRMLVRAWRRLRSACEDCGSELDLHCLFGLDYCRTCAAADMASEDEHG